MQQIFYLIQKEFRQVFRDPAMLAIMFFVPLVQMVVLGFALTVDVKNVRTVIVDYDDSATSRALIRRFENNPYFTVVGHVKGNSAIRRELDAWHAQLAIVVPLDFSRSLARGTAPSVQVIADGVDGNTAGISLGYARGVLEGYATTELLRSGRTTTSAAGIPSFVVPLARMWYNLNLESKNYMVPGLIAVLLTLLSMFLTSMGLVREKELGTLEQLMVTPIGTWQLILGKVLPFLILCFFELGLTIGVAFLVFQLQAAGSLVLLFGLATLYLLSTLGLGIFISTLAQTQQQAMFISWFFMIFMIFMSGFLFPIRNMPHIVQLLTYVDPMRYFVIILREIFLKGGSVENLLNEIGWLAGFGLVIISLSSLKFRKRVS
jgi:ABC-2 type transport system permease protein